MTETSPVACTSLLGATRWISLAKNWLTKREKGREREGEKGRKKKYYFHRNYYDYYFIIISVNVIYNIVATLVTVQNVIVSLVTAIFTVLFLLITIVTHTNKLTDRKIRPASIERILWQS